VYRHPRTPISFLFLGGAAEQGCRLCPGFPMAAPPKNKKLGGRWLRPTHRLPLRGLGKGKSGPDCPPSGDDQMGHQDACKV